MKKIIFIAEICLLRTFNQHHYDYIYININIQIYCNLTADHKNSKYLDRNYH